MAHVLAGKRLLLLREFIRESGHLNVDALTHKIASSFAVVGSLSIFWRFFFSPRSRTLATSIETLWIGAKAVQRTGIASMRPKGEDGLARVWAFDPMMGSVCFPSYVPLHVQIALVRSVVKKHVVRARNS